MNQIVVSALADTVAKILFANSNSSNRIFSSETYVAAESAGSVEVCVILNIPYSFVLEFTVNARDMGSATAGMFKSV